MITKLIWCHAIVNSMGNFIDVTIPFDKTGFEDNVHDNVHDDLSVIKQLIRSNHQISLQ